MARDADRGPSSSITGKNLLQHVTSAVQDGAHRCVHRVQVRSRSRGASPVTPDPHTGHTYIYDAPITLTTHSLELLDS